MKNKKELIEWITNLYNEGNCSIEFYDKFIKALNSNSPNK